MTPDRTVHAVNGVSFEVKRGEVLGILGESGSGKSVTLRAILQLHPEHRTRWSGSIKLEGDEVLDMTGSALANLRGRRVAMIFQEPMTALDPVFTIGQQIAETIKRHTGKSRRRCMEARQGPARDGAHPLAGAAPEGLSARDVGRHAPARHDRAGAVVQSAACCWPTSRPRRSTRPCRSRCSC